MTKVIKIKNQIRPILKSHQVKKAAIFGSYAQGTQKKSSDLDLVIQFSGKKSLYDLVDLQQVLEDKLNMKVDLLTYKGINPLLKAFVDAYQIKVI